MNLIICGDFFPGNRSEQSAINYPKTLWGDVLNIFADADIRIVNLECPLTTYNIPEPKTGPNLKSSPESVNALKIANIDLVTLANNHILDYGQIGLEETLRTCATHNISTVGAGLTLEQATTPCFFNLDGRTIGVVNISENEWSSATDTRGGANPYDIIGIIGQLHSAKRTADIVVLIIHGGHEFYQYPSPRMVKEFRFFAEHGASVIICHHSHCFSGFEIHKNVPIFYGLGNLFFPSDIKFEGWYRGFFLNLYLNKAENLEWNIVPYTQSVLYDGIAILSDRDKTLFENDLDGLNKVISNHTELLYQWNNFVDSRTRYYLNSITLPSVILRKLFSKLKLHNIFASKSRLRYINNFVRNESHRDSLLKVLDKVCM